MNYRQIWRHVECINDCHVAFPKYVNPAPIVNVPAAQPSPVKVNVTNDVQIPQAQKINVERDSDGRITGATIQRNGTA